MNTQSIRFLCPTCSARIKAPVQLSGRSRVCPGCKHTFTVPHFVPTDAAPLFVLIEGDERCTLGIAYRRSA
jgi:uncharacterized paraquat-inducible protein A